MGSPLSILLLRLVGVSFFWEGVLCQSNAYTLQVPPSVTVREGLCVVIPCNFTYDQEHFAGTDQLYGYWYEERSNPEWDPPVATNDKRKNVQVYAHNRFHLSENVRQGDCSLTINQARRSDAKVYFFRIEKGTRWDRPKYSYPNLLLVTVREEENPEIRILGTLQAGHPVNMTCIAPRSCSLNPPHITWRNFPKNGTAEIFDVSSETGVQSSVVTFTPSVEDNEQHITCIVNYGEGSLAVSIEARLILNVSYPPQKLRISGTRRGHIGQTVQHFTDVSHLDAQEGDNIRLRCEAEGNPLPNVTWVRPKSPPISSDLNIYHLELKNKGEYTCQAQNTVGSANATFQIYMPFSPEPCEEGSFNCWEGSNGFLCNCSICSYPAPKIQWQVDGKTLDRNDTTEQMKAISWNETEKATSTLHLTGTWEGEHQVICRGTNSKGQLSQKLLLHVAKRTGNNVLSGVIGGAIMLVAIVLIVSIILSCKKCRETMTGSEPYTNLSLNPSNVKGSRVPISNQKEAKDVSKEPEKMEESFYDEYEDLHYASIQFNVNKPTSEKESLRDTLSEYAEIRTS